MSDTTKITAEALERLKADIHELETQGRREIAERIGIAREWGDLKENAEYHAAKEEAAQLETKITRLKDQVRSAEVVEPAVSGAAGMGSTVTYADEKSGKQLTHKLVPQPEAKPADGLLSIDSPVGRALSGAKVGDSRTLETPSGQRTMKVLDIEHS